MKKLLLPTLIICLAVLASCKKDSDSQDDGGDVTAVKRIDELYFGYTSIYEYSIDSGQTWNTETYENESHLSQKWQWDGNKIRSIAYSDNYDEVVYCNDNYEYNNKGLVSSITRSWVNYDDIERMEFVYNSSKIAGIEIYYNGIHQSSWICHYSTGKLTRVKCTYSNDDTLKINKDRYVGLFGLDKKMFRSNDGDLLTIDLTWAGNNLTKMQHSDGYYCEYTYDNNKNPYHGCNALDAYACFESFSSLSENNVLTWHRYYSYDEEYFYNYSYEYSNNYPYKEIYDERYHYDNGMGYIVNETYYNKWTFYYLTE